MPLLDSRAFIDGVSSLDPGADDFADRLGDAIRSASPGTQHRDQQRAGDDQRQWSMDDVERARAENPALIFSAQQNGRLRDLGYAPTGESIGPNFDRRYANDKHVRRQQRRRQLTADYGGEDGRLRWIHAGKLAHLGIPAQKRRGMG